MAMFKSKFGIGEEVTIKSNGEVAKIFGMTFSATDVPEINISYNVINHAHPWPHNYMTVPETHLADNTSKG